MQTLLVLVGIGAGCIEAEALVKSAKICNQTSKTLWAAIGWTANLVGQSEGWYEISRGECATLHTEDADKLAWVYAIAHDGENVYLPESDIKSDFCISNTAFRHSSLKCGGVNAAANIVAPSMNGIYNWTEFGLMRQDAWLYNFEKYIWHVR